MNLTFELDFIEDEPAHKIQVCWSKVLSGDSNSPQGCEVAVTQSSWVHPKVKGHPEFMG